MRLRSFALAALLLAVPARAEDAPRVPTLVVRLKSIEGLAADAKFLGRAVGRADEVDQVEGLLKALAGDNGLEGLDPKKPIGLYAFLGPNAVDSEAVLLIPVAAEKTILDTLNRFDIKPQKDKDGVYSFQPGNSPFPIHFRFADGYAHVTVRDAETIASKRLLRPAAIFPEKESATLSASLQLGGIPKDLRETILGQLELRLADLKEKKPDEAKSQHAFRSKVVDEGVAFVKRLLTDEGSLSFRLAADEKANQVSMSASLSGKPGSKLATSIKELGEVKSTVAGLIGTGSAMSFRLHVALPEELRKALGPVVDETFGQVAESVPDAEGKAALGQFFKVFGPTVKQADLDLAVDLRGPGEGKHYGAVVGLGLKNGGDVEKAVKDAAGKLPEEERKRVSLDVDKVGDVSIHRLNIEKDLDEDSRRNLGENPLYFALADQALYLAVGPDGLAALKKAVAVRPATSPLARLEMSLSKLAPLMARDRKAAPKAAEEAFGKQGEGDQVVFALEGGEALRLRMTMQGPVLKFFALLDQAQKEGR